MLKKEKILITGNMGYLGPTVEEYLSATMSEVTLVGMDCGYYAHCLTGADVLPETRIQQQFFSDVRDATDIMFEDVTSVVHLAAISNDPMGDLFKTATEQINHNATVNIARRAKAAGAKAFVFASSCSVYGMADDDARTEKSPLNPLTAYARSKVASELDLASLADANFQITCLRFPTACGMSERLRLDLVINDFVASALVNGKITILSDGSPWRPMIDIRDMARAIHWALQRDPEEGGSFLAVNAGKNEYNYQVRELACLASEICGGAKISFNPDAIPDNRSYKVNFDLFNDLTPKGTLKYDIASTIKELKDGLGKMSFQDSHFRTTQWMRLKVLQHHLDRGALDDKLRWIVQKSRIDD
jgi:nucleoside-diphosphate-sugar epimerase